MDKHTMDAILGPSDKPEGSPEQHDDMEIVAQELIEALHARNPKDVAEALRAALSCADKPRE